jgi:hypothetical protein
MWQKPMTKDSPLDGEQPAARPLRILALNHRCFRHPQAGGAEANLFACARSWARAGHHVTVFCADPGRAHAPEREEVVDGVSIVRRGGRQSRTLSPLAWAADHSRLFWSLNLGTTFSTNKGG